MSANILKWLYSSLFSKFSNTKGIKWSYLRRLVLGHFQANGYHAVFDKVQIMAAVQIDSRNDCFHGGRERVAANLTKLTGVDNDTGIEPNVMRNSSEVVVVA